MALYYSGNALDWHNAGIVDYHLSFGRHFTYPHMIVDKDDLLIVMRASFAPAGDDEPAPPSPNSDYYKCVSVLIKGSMPWTQYPPFECPFPVISALIPLHLLELVMYEGERAGARNREICAVVRHRITHYQDVFRPAN